MNIHIPVPCHEDWNNMNPEDKGRFCGLCKKTVIDFTAMSDDEVRFYLLHKQGQETCGRFNRSQLSPAVHVSLSRTWFAQLPAARQLVYAVALFFIVGISSCDFSADHPVTAATGTDTSVSLIPATMGITLSPPIPADTVSVLQPHKSKAVKKHKRKAIIGVEPEAYTVMGGVSAVVNEEPVPAPLPELPPAPPDPVPAPVTGKMVVDTLGQK